RLLKQMVFLPPDGALLKALTPEETTRCQHGLFFQDGQRRVDYVLTYHVKKPGAGRSGRQSVYQLTEKAVARSLRRGPYNHKAFRREEFEGKLRDMGVGFLKIHAPWSVLCREAEFMKLKMPTKKVSPTRALKISSLISKILEPLHPHVEENQPKNIKHLSHTFSREKQHLFDLSDKDYFFDSKTRSSIVSLISIRFQPDSPRACTETRVQGKGCFIRDICGFVLLLRKYFGEKIGLYFAWLGLADRVCGGVCVCVCVCVIPSMEICHPRNNITMCPLCDRGSGCADCFPPALMCFLPVGLPAAMFMEHWKRRQMRLNYEWDLTGFEDEEDHPRAEYEFRVMQKSMRKDRRAQHKVPSTSSPRNLQIGVTFAIVFGVILYPDLHQSCSSHEFQPITRNHVQLTVKTTAAIINLVVILILDEVYGRDLCSLLEAPKTDKSFEERLIFKTFILKFVNAFTPIIYIAFFRGRLVGRPGSYLYVFESYRMEEVSSHCSHKEMTYDHQTSHAGKQLIQNNLFESECPEKTNSVHSLKTWSLSEEERQKKLQRYEIDHFLEPFGGLTPEYMEMIIQFGFVTLFVASFPLAPLFALLNNIIEIRLDAKKFVTELRRPVAARAKTSVGVAKVAVIINAFVISFTSDFIPRMVYQYMYSPDGSMHGFVNHTLSYFNVSHFQEGKETMSPMQLASPWRYADYREPPWSATPYEISKEFWTVLAVRLAFVIVFQNVVLLMNDVVDWLIPDIPKDISLQIHKEKILLVDLFMKEEHGKIFVYESAAPAGEKESGGRANNSTAAQPRSRPNANSTKSF
uniref:Anoctamin n=1 Tax=Salarias fasciatus TaxID=181472 RepID=A0A672FJ30_SALFA